MSRQHKALAGRRWDRIRRVMLSRKNWTCERCGRYANEVYDESNLEVVCKTCHVDHHLPGVPGLREWRRHVKGHIHA